MTRGYAAGANVFRRSDGRFQWSAYGPVGGNMGTARTEAEAWEKARAALSTLDHASTASPDQIRRIEWGVN